jgi:hypothetical protein
MNPLLLPEILLAISAYIDKGKDYKSLVSTCGLWYKVVASPAKAHTYMNVISTFVSQNRDISKWRWDMISEHLTTDLLVEFKDKLTDYQFSSNPRLTRDIVDAYPQHIDRIFLLSNPLFTEDVLSTEHINWFNVGNKSFITMDLILKYKDKLNLQMLAHNPNLTPEFIRNNMHVWSPIICEHSSMNMELIREFKHTHYIRAFSRNPNLTPEFIRENANDLSWTALTQNPALELPLIREFIDKIDWYWIGTNINIDLKFVIQYKDKINWNLTSFNKKLITEEFARLFAGRLDWDAIVSRKSLSESFIREHIKYVDWTVGVWNNPNITIAFMCEFKDKFKGILYE